MAKSTVYFTNELTPEAVVKMDMLHPPYSFRFPCLCF